HAADLDFYLSGVVLVVRSWAGCGVIVDDAGGFVADVRGVHCGDPAEGDAMIPTDRIDDSSGNSGGWYRARGWWGGRAPNTDSYRPALTHPSMGQHLGRLV